MSNLNEISSITKKKKGGKIQCPHCEKELKTIERWESEEVLRRYSLNGATVQRIDSNRSEENEPSDWRCPECRHGISNRNIIEKIEEMSGIENFPF